MSPKRKVDVGKAAGAAVDTAFTAVGTVIKIIITVLLILVTTGLLFTCIFALYVKTCLTEDLDVSLSDFTLAQSSSILYEDRDGNWQELVMLSSSEKRIWVDYEDIPKDLQHALIAIEDKRFYDHKGVDWYRTVGAFANMFIGMKNDFGGSTITQQLIKNLTKFDEATVQRKLLEIFRALEFEKKYDKDEIIMWYLNRVYFGEGSYGAAAAADTYFGKTLDQLSVAECASLVGIINWPSKYSPFASVANNKERQEVVLRTMYEEGYINYEEYIAAKEEPLVFVRSENEAYEQEIYTYYEEAVYYDVINDLMAQKGVNRETAELMLTSGGYRIYSCIDPRIQAIVDSVYEDTANLPQAWRPSEKQQMQSAIVVMDPYTGKIVAMSGGVGEKTINFGTNRATQSQRPPGSSLKPLSVYGPALEYGLITQNTLVNDAGADKIQLAHTTWYPRNAGGANYGIMTVKQALAQSLNTIAAQILDKLGIGASYEYLTQKLGFTTLIEADRNYPSLALGELTNGVTAREMTQAFCAFANDGVFTKSRTYTRVTDANGNVILENSPQTHVAWTANTAYNMLSMLQNAVRNGTGSEAYLNNMPVAGKTGTSSNSWTRWFAGTTPYYTAAVWTGYDQPETMNFYGNPSAQIWKRVMAAVHEGLEYRSFPEPIVGGDTQLFGDLKKELEEQLHPSPSPTPAPTPTPTPEPTPIPTEPSTVDEPLPPVTEPDEPDTPLIP